MMSLLLPELGLLLLLTGASCSLVMALLLFYAAHHRHALLLALARPLALLQWLAMSGSFACLLLLFAGNDFSVRYVAHNANSAMPLPYRLGAAWGGHEGSLQLWTLLLSLWTLAVAVCSRRLPAVTRAQILATMGLINAGFTLLLAASANPFARLEVIPVDGRELNPLLQDPGLIFHPPLLYMGYAGFAVVFAIAITGLLSGRIDAAWARWARPWTICAWMFLTAGIALGSLWAYYELGWGGWWFWDPVENASIMPWLLGTALLHSLAATEKRGVFKRWTVLLAILTFSFALIGAFLVRSGVLSSVHAFTSDPRRGLLILLLTALIIAASLLLYALRADRLHGDSQFAPLSREAMLLANNILLCVATASVLLGTLYPLLLDALDLGKLSVGPPYFNQVLLPIFLPLLLCTGLGPQLRWKQQKLAALLPALGRILLCCGGLTLVWSGLFSPPSVLTVLGVFAALWIASSIVHALQQRLRGGKRLSMATAGMHLAHLGLAVTTAGIALSAAYSLETDTQLGIGQSVRLGDYQFSLLSVEQGLGPNYLTSTARIQVWQQGKPLRVLMPEKRRYQSQPDMPISEAAIAAGPFSHLYATLADPIDNGSWGVRLYYKPMVSWIWAGAALMALGGLLAAVDRRYRRAGAAS